MRKKLVRSTDIKSIKPEPSQFGFFVVTHKTGRIVVLNQFDGFHEFIGELKRSNPSVELRGC